ncbi:uncharacterized protein LOC111887988 [Lactuca sativa]|uniref:uncharacterized protein LOC111887988 n=1 Tax=Lactuca sativa TaxID=4236 RepID=UPI000CBF0B82|nr:uncharacterized protein LOC111887988 [Lactuca sativa]
MEAHPLLQSLIATTSTSTTYGVRALSSPPPKVDSHVISNVSGILFRLTLITFIGFMAIWANHEASKGFSITIVNDAGKYSLPGKHFSLFYQANDKATRIVLNTSRFVENLLYPNKDFLHMRKQIDGVTLRLAPTVFPGTVAVDSRKPYEYIISLSPLIMETSNNNEEAIVLAVLQGMARVWLWDGNGATPPVLLNGMVEYISSLAGFTLAEAWTSGGDATRLPEKNVVCWTDEQPRMVAWFLRYCDQRKQPGGGGGGGGEVIRRLNQKMRTGWHDWMMDEALGMAGQHACASYDILIRHHNLLSSM